MKAPQGSPAESAGALYVKTPITPEEIFRAIGRLRKEARGEIDRLIRFLDNHMELEDVDEDGEEEDAEPSLGSFDWMSNLGSLAHRRLRRLSWRPLLFQNLILKGDDSKPGTALATTGPGSDPSHNGCWNHDSG
ncbi:hypothetical protein KIP88_46005 [Bradyrhizobium sp. SRL28]|uniref:hypothetical protein n=1 Tax=Bradyrhizobium sp. SRL28 TaxID=2836178 RepID=UPI001BDDD7EC|nr:hypothetical protein [Bradyrhizobium sp. SRL28]MBT1517623.1 hypothetical protein [Bradyrhizobium sp. SRL28]